MLRGGFGLLGRALRTRAAAAWTSSRPLHASQSQPLSEQAAAGTGRAKLGWPGVGFSCFRVGTPQRRLLACSSSSSSGSFRGLHGRMGDGGAFVRERTSPFLGFTLESSSSISNSFNSFCFPSSSQQQVRRLGGKKMKSYSSYKRRFKLSPGGEYTRPRGGNAHNAFPKSKTRKRRLRQSTTTSKGFAKVMKRLGFKSKKYNG